MNQTNDSENEKSLEWLKSQNKPLPFDAPEDYFEQLHSRIQQRINAKPQPWHERFFSLATNYKFALPVAVGICLVAAILIYRQPENMLQADNNITLEDVLTEGYDVQLNTSQIAEVLPEDLSFQEFDSEEMIDYLNVQDFKIDGTIDSIEF
ncbi:MAG: hypothetical protein IPO27_17995 [Bacteroidetes bacterium]|nr:hypothetical protein [Bacteroidota bacterium]